MSNPKVLWPFLVSVLLALAVLAPIPAVSATTPRLASSTAAAIDWDYVINYHSGKCVNVQGASTSNGAAIIQYTCGTAAGNDLWEFRSVGSAWYQMVNQNSGKCANVKGAATGNGAPVIQYTCGTSKLNDVWYLSSSNHPNYVYIINDYSGKCLNVQGASTSNGAAIVQYTCGAANGNDLWYIE